MRKKTNEIATHTDNKELSSHPIKTHVRRRENKQVLQIIIISELTFPKHRVHSTHDTHNLPKFGQTQPTTPPKIPKIPICREQ